jgi:mono/diheme cytochrome c family protein
MHATRRTIMASAILLATFACATAPNVRTPLGAYLSPNAKTGATVPLRVDPNAGVVLSGAAGLPSAQFLPSQAKRGEQLYTQSCGTCHGAGTLVGAAFVQSWNNRRVYDLYSIIRSTMPLDNPGGMKDGDYLDVVAYLLQANKQQTDRPDSLKSDTVSMRGTRIAVSAP